MSKHRVICEKCEREMLELYQVHGPAKQPVTRILHCEGCSGVIAVQHVSSKTANKAVKTGAQLKEEDNQVVMPLVAPKQIEIIREVFDPEKLRARLLGE